MTAPAATHPGSADRSPRRPLGRPFAAQLGSTSLANLGDGVLVTLVPLVALGLTSSPFQISLLAAATWLPWLLLGITAGVVIDRVDRRRAQIGALLARAVLLAVAALVVATGHLTVPVLVALVLAHGVTEVLADLGASAILPDLVPSDRLAAANGRVLGAQQVANSFLGSPLAGALLVVGAGVGFGVAAALAALAALTLALGLRGRFGRASVPDGAATSATPTTSALAEVREGLAFLVRHRALRPLVLTAGVLNMASTGYFAVFVLWVVGPGSAVGLRESHYPLLLVTLATGAVLGSLLAERAERRFGAVRTMRTTLTATVVLMLVPLVWPAGPAIAVALFVMGLLTTAGNVISMSLRQRLVPRSMLGRVGGAGRTLAYGLMPVGALLGGTVAERWSLEATFVGAVVISLAACTYLAATVRPAGVARLLADAEQPAAAPVPR
ncbi:MFS transporter [Litorihabitans aurantiacus]|uniref:MFS transporter n=1 Tax=Litorihabitans aurantiacus TaxID=1930061 RepID=A0AA37UN44_9MICO|nr:MFS transporter [Litorihabitans aurantiacus]GMA30158.1 MFS transporter [Litorihabitans aurantiacus]